MKKKIQKIILSIFGACNVLMSLFIPLAVAVLWVTRFGSTIDTTFGTLTIIIIACISTLYRAINIGWMREEE